MKEKECDCGVCEIVATRVPKSLTVEYDPDGHNYAHEGDENWFRLCHTNL